MKYFCTSSTLVATMIGLVLICLSGGTTSAQEKPGASDSVEDELRRLEEDLGGAKSDAADPARPAPAQPAPSATGVGAAGAQSMNPDISFIASFALAWFSDDPDLVGGHDPAAVGFNLQGLEMAVSASVDPYFRFDSFIVLSLFGLEIEEAFGTTLALPWGLQARAGQYLTRFGRINPTHLHAWNFVSQPLVIGKYFGGEGLRGLGTELSWLTPLPWFAELTFGVQNIAGGATGRSFLGSDAELESLLDLTLSARLEQFFELSSSTALLWGLSGVNGANSTGRNNRTDVLGTDLLLKWNPAASGGYVEIGWQTEALLRRRQYAGPPEEDTGGVLQDFGGYTELYWSPNLFWRFAGRYEYVSGLEDDYLDPDWSRDRHRGAANITWAPSHFSRLRLEYGLDWLPYRAQLGEAEIVHMTFLQLELVSGAHGAHRY